MGNRKAEAVPAKPMRAKRRRGYDVRYFAIKYELAVNEALKLIARIGNNRAKLDEAVLRVKRY